MVCMGTVSNNIDIVCFFIHRDSHYTGTLTNSQYMACIGYCVMFTFYHLVYIDTI